MCEVSAGRAGVREEPGSFAPLIGAWESALLGDNLVGRGHLCGADTAELIAVNETSVDLVREVLLASRP